MSFLDPTHVQTALARLRTISSNSDIFGAGGHKFRLEPPLAEIDVLEFEHRHRIRLPADYRDFLTQIGNGGAGPYYGIFPLGLMDDSHGFRHWREQDGFVGTLSEAFPLDHEWNELTAMPPDDLQEDNEAEYDRLFDEFDKTYWNTSRVNGAIPLCHQGCALRVWLVVTGKEAGHLWHDGRADYTGLKPIRIGAGARATFSSWYNDWLGNVIRALLK